MDSARSYYAGVEKRVYERLKYQQAVDEPFAQEGRYLSILQAVMQFYAQGQAVREAAGVSDKLYELTGDSQMQQYGNQLRDAMGG